MSRKRRLDHARRIAQFCFPVRRVSNEDPGKCHTWSVRVPSLRSSVDDQYSGFGSAMVWLKGGSVRGDGRFGVALVASLLLLARF